MQWGGSFLVREILNYWASYKQSCVDWFSYHLLEVPKTKKKKKDLYLHKSPYFLYWSEKLRQKKQDVQAWNNAFLDLKFLKLFDTRIYLNIFKVVLEENTTP